MNDTRQSIFRTTACWLIVWCVIAVLGMFGIRTRLKTEKAELHARLEKQVQEVMDKGKNDLNLLEQDLKQKGRDAEERRRAKAEKEWGGPIAAAFKNPAFSLRDALLGAAEACAPTNAVAHAEVDRFTEFVVTIDSSEAISTNQMIAVARQLMPMAKEYLSALRFSTLGNVIAELDRQDIEFIDDWASVPDQRIAMLLPRETESRMDPATIERLKDEQRISEALTAEPGLRDKTERADRNLRQAIQNAYGELTLALESLQKSASIGEVHSLRDIDRCDQELRTAVEHAGHARTFWSDPTKEWRRLLEGEGISGELRDVLVKSFPGIFRDDPAKTAKVFETLNGQIESCRYVLRLLENETDKWKFSGGGIALVDDEFARKFERAQRQVREDMQATEAALRDWHETIGP